MSEGVHIEIKPTADGVWLSAAAGRARVSKVGMTVIRVDVEGHAYAEFAEVMLAPLDRLIANEGRVFLGIDGEGMASYDARFRYLWTEWIKRNRSHLDGVLLLFGSRAIESAAVVINAVTGTKEVQTCDSRELFETRLDDEILDARRR
ncbi:hypothetical protein PPSIR1_06723 [Plesiocystis pacifica SIR-1]|uniref:STAS domain-containing protein n=1 Tax=Plesiocystis pacifica SIR-1 TaxID=391625 RepID=A6GDJ8_9BACT|nr:hypothetical protein [Plesiocystis pacifica]EDM76041.1 hypothetical protein PPSIR1_06723 [Plesiocystis pacifica SIR-1]